MPIEGYTSLMVRTEMAEQIESLIDQLYHGHTFASAVNTMQRDLKEGRLRPTLHDIRYPEGPPKKGKRFASISVKNDIMDWFEEERKKHYDDYLRKYGKPGANRLGPFAVRFLLNLLLSKRDQEDLTVKLSPDDFAFLQREFEKSKAKYGADTFEVFLPLFIRDLVRGKSRAR